MSYNTDEIYNFFLKDAKTNISILVQSAFNKAVDTLIAQELKGKTIPQIVEDVLNLRDKYFQENMKKVEEEYTNFININTPEKWLNQQKEIKELMQEAQENIVPSIQTHETENLF
jgi:uncharacterized protein YxjI